MSEPTPTPDAAGAVDYRLAPAVRARVVGVLLVALAVVVFGVTALVIVLKLPLDVLSAMVILVVLAVVGLGVITSRWGYVVRADEVGYRVRWVRGVGADRARWSDVLDMLATHVGGARCVVLRLRDGRTTTIPVELLAMDGDDFVRAMRDHLDAPGARR